MSKYKTYSYPRVNTSVTALEHKSGVPEAEDTTVLFVPFVSEKGPLDEIRKIHSLEEFQATYGEIKNYVDRIGKLTAFNIMNWLTAGGTIYAFRLSGENTKHATFSADGEGYTAEGKIIGNMLNSYTIKVEKTTDYFFLSVKTNNITIERITIKREKGKDNSQLAKEEYTNLNSEYISSFKFENVAITDNPVVELTVKDENKGTDGLDEKSFNEILKSFWLRDDSVKLAYSASIIANSLETPIDLIMDAGYPKDVKLAMMKFIADMDKDGAERSASDPAIRSDIRGYFEIFEEGDTSNKTYEESTAFIGDFNKDPNIFIYSQSTKVNDSVFSNDEITVGPTYFLSQLIPANDINNGIQYPVAGLRRGELTGVNSLSWNPMPEEKEALFAARINYIEKDSRGYYFMSQRTMEAANKNGNNTALTFINNSRVVCRMVHELERLGRSYLFEFNDSTTLSNMSAVLNRYVSNWIANRTLSYGEVVVSKSTDEAVNVSLNIKFTGTIEVISIDIVIQ